MAGVILICYRFIDIKENKKISIEYESQHKELFMFEK
jgi:hypothetical protein